MRKDARTAQVHFPLGTEAMLQQGKHKECSLVYGYILFNRCLPRVPLTAYPTWNLFWNESDVLSVQSRFKQCHSLPNIHNLNNVAKKRATLVKLEFRNCRNYSNVNYIFIFFCYYMRSRVILQKPQLLFLCIYRCRLTVDVC